MSDFTLPRIARLARKELSETLRDRRTIITLVLMPVLLYPLLGMAFHFYLSTSAPAGQPKAYRIAFASEADVRRLIQLLELTEEDPIAPFVTDDVEARVRNGEVDLGVELRHEGEAFILLDPRDHLQVTLRRRDDQPNGLKAEDFFVERLAKANVRTLKLRLQQAVRLREVPMPINVDLQLIKTPETKAGSYVATLVPLVLVLMTITGAVYPAIDLTAGERERGTLELLMAAPVSRVSLLLAKYVAVMFVAVLTGVINLSMMTLTLWISGLSKLLFADGPPGVGTVISVLALLVLFAAFFAAVLLAITSFARSFKEAQAYLIPVMLLALSPGIASLLPGMRLGGFLTVVPLLNIVLLARELLEGVAAPTLAAAVVVSTLLYAFAAIGLAARLFGAEAVLYSEQAHWSDLFRRPKERAGVATLNAALLTLAVMFPAAFLMHGVLAQMRGLEPWARLLISIPGSILLFIGIPSISAYQGRLRLPSAFALQAPAPLALIGAVLLGLTAWPFVYELTRLMEAVGFSSLSEQVRQSAVAQAARWRETPVLVLLALGIVPAVVEELFFRGMLYGAIAATTRPRSAILASGVLFGLFHILFSGALSIERLLPSTLMGLLLGWVRWRSGSVWPGVLLHTAHNCFLLSAYLFPGLIGPAAEGEHLPATWYGVAVVGGGLGAQLVWFGSKRSE